MKYFFSFQDIVEVGDRPTLASKSAAYDRFGFAIETPGNTLEEKAEFLRKQAENNHDNLEDGAEHVRKFVIHYFQKSREIVVVSTNFTQKNEFLWKQVENNHDNLEVGAEHVMIFCLKLFFKIGLELSKKAEFLSMQA